MKKMRYAAAALAAAAIMTAGLGQAWAYFTTYATAEGGYVINLGDRTEITESFSDWTKTVTVTNEEGAAPVYVRVKAFGPSTYDLIYEGAGWTAGAEGYYYYEGMVSGGGSTGPLSIRINGIPADAKDGDTFNVIVIYESTPVLYDENGGALPADWTAVLDVTTSTETVRPPENGGTTETTASSETTASPETTAGAETTASPGTTAGSEEGNTPGEEGGGES